MKLINNGYSYRRLALALALAAPVAGMAATQAGFVLVASGSVKAVGADGTTRTLARRSPVFAGDRLVTAPGARAQVKFSDGAIVGLKPSSELRIDDYRYGEAGGNASVMSLIKGGFRTVTGAIGKASKADYKVSTPVATIGIRGTLYEADYTPGEGLDLAVWDGGISACNSAGCLDLGLGADHRFGHVAEDGASEGLDSEPGIKEEEDDEGALGNLQGDLAGDGFAPDLDGKRARYPLAGFAAVGHGDNPWGSEQLLDIPYAAHIEASAQAYGGFALQSSTADNQFIEPGYYCEGGYLCAYYGVPNVATLGSTGETTVMWGQWYGGDVSLNTSNSGPTDIGIFGPGVFAVGTPATPDVVATLTGTTSFSLYDMLTINSGMIGYGGSGYMTVDLGAGLASGSLQVTDTTSDYWNIAFDGAVSTSGFSMAVTTDAVNPTGGSYYNAGGTGPAIAVEGVIQGSFVGASAVDGLVGNFAVQTADADSTAQPVIPPTDTLQGVFIMQSYVIGQEVGI